MQSKLPQVVKPSHDCEKVVLYANSLCDLACDLWGLIDLMMTESASSPIVVFYKVLINHNIPQQHPMTVQAITDHIKALIVQQLEEQSCIQ